MLRFKTTHSVFALTLFSLCSYAQVGGAISGVVKDQSGAVVSAAKVIVTNAETNLSHEVKVNAQGAYSVPNLRPGDYSVTASAPGFKTAKRAGIDLQVAGEVVVDIELSLGEVNETVQVTGAAPEVEQTNSTLSYSVESNTVRELPLNGRDWTMLALQEPGVGTVDQSALAVSNQRANRGLGAQMSIGGNRPQQNNYRLDGVSINDYSNGGPGSILGEVLGVEAVQEFSVVTNNAPANFGRTGGGVINAVTRPGTNAFHGSAYEFLRNSDLDARNFFDHAIPPFRRNQFGADAGGPIVRNRTFVFADYEGVRQSLTTTQVNTVPSATARNGQLAAGAVAVSPVIAPYLALYPLPNGAVSGDTGVYTLPTATASNEDFFTTRVDHTFSTEDTLFATYMFDNGKTTAPDAFGNNLLGTTSRRQAVVLEETHVFTPAIVNAFRAGFSRVVSEAPKSLSAINPVAADTKLGFLPGDAVGLINVTGLTNFPGGQGAVGEYDFHFNSFQVYDDAFVSHGLHTFKFGFNVERIDDNELGKSNPTGQFIFGSLAAFLTDQPSTFNAPIGTGITPRGIRETIAAGYFLDEWRVAKTFSLNLGLRYEMANVPSEVQGKLTNLPSLTATQPHLGSPYFNNPTTRNFEPRVSFAWDPFGNGKTAIRGGAGLFDNLPLPYLFELPSLLSAPYFETGSVANPPGSAFPTGGLALLTPTTFRYAYIEPNPKRSYVAQWNLNVQRELLPDTTLTVGYAGSRGIHLPFFVNDFNMVLPTATPQGYLWPLNGTRLNPAVGQISGTLWNTDSVYHSLVVQLSRRMRKNWQVSAAYTFGRSIDAGSSSLASDTFTNTVQRLPFDPKTGRGLSDFNIQSNFALNSIVDLPSLHDSPAALRLVAGGWQFTQLLRAATGTPFTPTIGGDPLGMKSSSTFDFPDAVPGCGSLTTGNPNHYINTSCFAFPNPSNRLGNVGRNVLIGPGLVDLDLALYKNFQVVEKVRLQFRGEFFNIVNHPNFAPPTSNLSLFGANGVPVSTAGLITTTLTTSRQIQFGLKLLW